MGLTTWVELVYQRKTGVLFDNNSLTTVNGTESDMEGLVDRANAVLDCCRKWCPAFRVLFHVGKSSVSKKETKEFSTLDTGTWKFGNLSSTWKRYKDKGYSCLVPLTSVDSLHLPTTAFTRPGNPAENFALDLEYGLQNRLKLLEHQAHLFDPSYSPEGSRSINSDLHFVIYIAIKFVSPLEHELEIANKTGHKPTILAIEIAVLKEKLAAKEKELEEHNKQLQEIAKLNMQFPSIHFGWPAPNTTAAVAAPSHGLSTGPAQPLGPLTSGTPNPTSISTIAHEEP